MSRICCARTRSRNTACASISASRSASPRPERLDAGKPRRRRALRHVVTDRERARRRHDAEQAGFLAVDAAIDGLEAAEPVERRRRRPGRLGQQLGERNLAGRAIEALAPERRRERRCRRGRRACRRRCRPKAGPAVRARDPVGNARRARSPASRATAGSSPSRRRRNRERRPHAGSRRHARRAPRTSDPQRPPGSPSANTSGVVLVHREQALAAPGRAEHRRMHRGRAGRLGPPRPCAARRARRRAASWRRARARSRPRSRGPTGLRAQDRPRPAPACPQARARLHAPAPGRCRSPSSTPLSARSRSRSRAESAPITRRLVGDAEVAHLEPVHPADREIGECIVRERSRAGGSSRR